MLGDFAGQLMLMIFAAVLISWRVIAGLGWAGRGWWRRGGRSACAAVLAVAVLAGCTSRPAQKPRPAPVQTNADGICVTSAEKGSCGPYRYSDITQSNGQSTYVGQNVWNPITGWHQTLQSRNPGNWSVTANMPAGNTAVVSFPNVGQQYYYSNTLADFRSIYSSFAESMHAVRGTSAEAAFDIWLNDWNNEVMIQHHIINRGSCPAQATATFGGAGGVPVQRWNLCKYGSELIWQLTGRGEASGRVNILAMLTWLVSHGYLPHRSGLTDISYGFEICSTGGHAETFSVSRFTISAPSS